MPTKLSTITKNFITFLKSFLTTSTIHGLNHISNRKHHPFEIVAWTLLVLFSTYWVANLSNQALMRYIDNPTVISIEHDYFSWNTSFPSATICPINKTGAIPLQGYAKNAKTIANKSELVVFLKNLAEADYDNFDKVVAYDGIKPEDYMKALLEVQMDFQPLITCPEGVECVLQKSVTEMGVCYSFNSQIAVYSSPEYWASKSWGLLKQPQELVVNPLDGDVLVNVVNIPGDYNLYIHGPYEMPDVTTKAIRVQEGYFSQFYLSPLSIFSTARVKRLMPRQRKCKYYDESHLPHSPVYSYILCRIECRIKLAKQLCGCVPHFYRKLDGEKTCDTKGLKCLSKYSERLKTLTAGCACLSNCDDVNYIVDDFDVRVWFAGSSLQYGLKHCPKMRLKRDLIFGFTDVLVYIGGLAGLFLGCSVLSFIEIFYVFTFRFYWFIKKKNTQQETRDT